MVTIPGMGTPGQTVYHRGTETRGPVDCHTYPRIQILTVEELLSGAQVAYPRLLDATFKQAPKARGAAVEQLKFDAAE